MAHHASAIKRLRQTERRTVVNGNRMGRIRTFVKKVEAALEAGDRTQATELFRVTESELMRGVTKGVLDKNTAARKVSRLSARVKALKA